jgi:hypothetical protein
MDVGQSIVALLKMVGQLLVIQTQQIQNGSLQIVNMHRVLDDGKTEFIGLAVGESTFDSTPGHSYGETVGVVVATEHIAIGGSTFSEWCPAKLTSPHNQGFIQQVSSFKIVCRRLNWLVHGGTFVRQTIPYAPVRIGSVEIPTPIK